MNIVKDLHSSLSNEGTSKTLQVVKRKIQSTTVYSQKRNAEMILQTDAKLTGSHQTLNILRTISSGQNQLHFYWQGLVHYYQNFTTYRVVKWAKSDR